MFCIHLYETVKYTNMKGSCRDNHIYIAVYILNDKRHADNVARLATATVKHHVSPCLTPDELAMLVHKSVISTDPLSFL